MPSPPDPAEDAVPPSVPPPSVGPPAPGKNPLFSAPKPPRRDFAAVEQSQHLLSAANIQFRRGQIADAEKAVLEILAQRPDDAAACELLGDIRLAQDDFDAARTAFKKALEAEPNRATAEAKLARATLRQTEDQRRRTLGVAYVAADTAIIRTSDGSDQKKTARLAVFGSVLLPGLGQFVNGQSLKGILVAGAFFLTLLVMAALPKMFLFVPSGTRRGGLSSPSGFLWFLVVILVAVWVYAVLDAALTSSRAGTHASRGRGKNGWDV